MDAFRAPGMVGDAVMLPGTYGRPSTPEHRKFAAGLFQLAEGLIREGKISSHAFGIEKEARLRFRAMSMICVLVMSGARGWWFPWLLRR